MQNIEGIIMVSLRTGIFTFAGQDVTIVGDDLAVGQWAPEFTVQAQDWATIQALSSTTGKTRIIGSLPSFNTTVCDREARRFNQEAAALGNQIAILMISMDLPFTLRHWCAAAEIDRVVTLSDHLHADFGKKYGVLIQEHRMFRRAIFVVNPQNILTYVAYMPTLGQEPNYQEALEAARATLG